ncbi:MAG: mycofactocin biosynthesis chaperone MftB [Actinobacteria bacterium]|nr:mycofactocin biosynthesis chaperone MftB [Actinomycetota bacterium]
MVFDVDRPYRINPQVAIRPESFGGIAYHHGNRRLLFLKSKTLVDVLDHLDGHESITGAVDSVTSTPRVAASLITALASLESSGIIDAR